MKIVVRDLEFSYNSQKILEDINFRISAGDFVGIIGSNGSGKTTLLKCLNKILRPKGCILINNISLDLVTDTDLAKKMSYVSQNAISKFPVTVFDAILMGRKPYISWSVSEEDLDKTAEIIDLLDLSNISMRNIDQLSGGQRQKVIIGRALAQDPEIMLLDEPTSNLDIKHQIEVLDMLKRLSETNVSVIIAIHDLNLALRYCSRLIMLKERKIHAAGSREILTKENIESVYGVRVSLLENKDTLVVIPEKSINNSIGS